MSALAFISYRRDDTGQIAQAFYLQLKELFGSGQLFMDVNSIRAGEAWPARVKRRLDAATVVLALIGPGWLMAADKNGRRRIDDRTDWVRNEIVQAFQKRIPIIPIAINHTKNLPDPAGLPRELRRLPLSQAKVLRLDPAEWAGDIRTLSDVLVDMGFVREPIPPQPTPSLRIKRTPALTQRQLADALQRLPEWEEWSDSLALEYPRVRQELRRTFTFTDFLEAIEFMHFLAPRLEKEKHHPRWANEWNVVRIRLTTWDAGNKITKIDVDTALIVDAVYRQFKARS